MNVDEIIEKVVTRNMNRDELDEYLDQLNLNGLYEFWGKMAKDHYDLLKVVSPVVRTTIALPRDFMVMVRLKANSRGLSLTQVIKEKLADFLLDK